MQIGFRFTVYFCVFKVNFCSYILYFLCLECKTNFLNAKQISGETLTNIIILYYSVLPGCIRDKGSSSCNSFGHH